MDEVLDDPWPGELLQVLAGLAQRNAVALDHADAEPLADQFVQPYTANRQLASCPAGWQPHLVDDLLNKCERTSRRGAGRIWDHDSLSSDDKCACLQRWEEVA